MPLRVNTNLGTNVVRRSLNVNLRKLENRIKRLATGLRINSAADDPAGLSISEGQRAQISGLTQAVRNVEQATNFLQQAGGTLNEVSGILGRLRELSVQASSSTLSTENRSTLQTEFSQLTAEIDRVSASSSPTANPVTFQVGADATQANQISVDADTLASSTADLNLSGASVATPEASRQSISQVDQAISRVSTQRGDIGAVQNRLSFSLRSSESAIESLQASESTIRDADVARETTAFARSRILAQANIALLAQVNVLPQRALSLLG